MFFNKIIDPNFIVRVLSDPKKHWSQNRISFAYLSNYTEEAIINFHHNDCNVTICPTIDDLRLDDTLYAFPEIADPDANGEATDPSYRRFRNAEMAYWFANGKKLEIDYDLTIRQYQSIDVENANDAIPIMRWIEWCRKVRDEVINIRIDDPAFDEYERFAMNLRKIERNGIRSV